MNWGPEKMLIRCSKESQHPAEWTPGLRLSTRRTRKTQRDGHNSWVKILQFMYGLQLPLTVKPHTTLSNPCNKVRGKYFVKEVFLRLLFIASVCIQHIYVYFCMNQQMTIQQAETWRKLLFTPRAIFKSSKRKKRDHFCYQTVRE